MLRELYFETGGMGVCVWSHPILSACSRPFLSIQDIWDILSLIFMCRGRKVLTHADIYVTLIDTIQEN